MLAYANHSTSMAIVTRYPGPRTLYWEYTNASNSADTHYVSSSEYPLLLGTLDRNGDKLIVGMDVVFGSTAATKTYQCNIGYTSWDAVQGFTGGVNIVSGATAHTSVSVHARGEMTRLSPTSEEHFALQALSSGAWQASRYGTGQVLWDQENTLRCHAKSSVVPRGR